MLRASELSEAEDTSLWTTMGLSNGLPPVPNDNEATTGAAAKDLALVYCFIAFSALSTTPLDGQLFFTTSAATVAAETIPFHDTLGIGVE